MSNPRKQAYRGRKFTAADKRGFDELQAMTEAAQAAQAALALQAAARSNPDVAWQLADKRQTNG